jgi:hypothetical protein
MDRDGHQGWTRASEKAWVRVFGQQPENCDHLPEYNPATLRTREEVCDSKSVSAEE